MPREQFNDYSYRLAEQYSINLNQATKSIIAELIALCDVGRVKAAIEILAGEPVPNWKTRMREIRAGLYSSQNKNLDDSALEAQQLPLVLLFFLFEAQQKKKSAQPQNDTSTETPE